MLSGFELLSAALFLVLLAWTFYSNVSSDFKNATPPKFMHLSRFQIKVSRMGIRLGSLVEICLAVLLLPVLRGMAIFKILGIQFEAAVRYHVWLGNVMILLAALHGIIIMSVWTAKHMFLSEMARWDEILTLPVQNPPTLEFSSADIVWSRVEGWKEMMDKVALIPFSRVNDFVRGESNRMECPTKFHVEARRRRPPEMPYKPKVDGILEYILYWCSFGPDDHRKGGVVRPSRNYTAKRKTPAGRPNTKRGCTCHFIVKRLIAEPTVALIIYNHEKHVDKQGSPCHGPMDKKAAGTCAMFAPYISEELRLQVMSLIYVGVPVETIMQRHTETVDNQGGPRNRDDLLTHRYVRRLERKIRRSTYELDTDDGISLNMWIESHRAHVFFYEDYSDSEPFVLGIQTEWQLQQMIRFGNRSLVASDSMFGTNKLKYPVHNLLVFDSNNNAIPVAWIITPRFASNETHRWLRSLYDRVHSKDPNWKLGGFIVDDPLADVHTIREVFQCSVLICYWRMRHAWHKNIMERCSEVEMRAEMFRQLGKVISSICRGEGDADSFEGFLEDFVDCSDFLDYFKATWLPRLGPWFAALKSLPVATAETCAAIECYHHQLKLRLLNEKDPSVYQRADWLVDKLGTKVHSYYWLDEFTGKASFARYWKDEWKSGLTSWCQALQIADADVIMDGKCARVNSQKNQDKVHTVWNPGSDFALCDCDWSRLGNLCKHAIKACILYREQGSAERSTSLVRYNQILSSILHCPPHDSLIRDLAVALTISVKTQLKGLFDRDNGGTAPSIFAGDREKTGSSIPAPRVAGNRDNSLTDVVGQTVTSSMTFASTQTEQVSLSEVLPLETEAMNGNSVAMETVEDRERTSDETCSAVNTSKTSVARDDAQGDLDVAHGGEKSSFSETGNAKCPATNAMTIIDPESVQSQPATIKSKVCHDASADECAFRTFEVLDNGKISCDVAECCSSDPMDTDCTERVTDVCHTSTNQAANDSNNSENVSDNPDVDLMRDQISTKSGVHEVVINGSNQGKAVGTAPVGRDCCGDVGAIIETDGCCNHREKQNVGNRLPNGQGLDFRSPIVAKDSAQHPECVPEEVPADKRMEILCTHECSTNDGAEANADLVSDRASAIDEESIKPPEEVCGSAMSAPVTGPRVDDQEVNSDEGKPMEMEIVPCAEAAEGASAVSLKT